MSTTKIAPCSCASAYQDQRYGTNKRVHNIGKKFSTCTVCGARKAV